MLGDLSHYIDMFCDYGILPEVSERRAICSCELVCGEVGSIYRG